MMTNVFKSRVFLVSITIIILLVLTNIVTSSLGPSEKLNKELSYRSNLGKCPSKSAGTMALLTVKEFEQTQSLRDVKKKMISEKWPEKYFVTEYKINFDPYSKVLDINFNCPEPLMKVQLYKNNGQDTYEAILADNGQLIDPTYEVLLRQDNKLKGNLPYLALPIGEMDAKVQKEITTIVKELRPELRKKLSEMILNNANELTIILSVSGMPSSVFLGSGEWSEKITKLDRIITYVEAKEKVPAVINLTNSKKVVVKFRDKF